MTIKKRATTIGRMMKTLEKSARKPRGEVTKVLRRSAKELVKLADQMEKKAKAGKKKK